MPAGPELKVGMKFRINKSIATIIKVSHPYVIIRTAGGSQICYGMLGIQEKDIIKDEVEVGTQLNLL